MVLSLGGLVSGLIFLLNLLVKNQIMKSIFFKVANFFAVAFPF